MKIFIHSELRITYQLRKGKNVTSIFQAKWSQSRHAAVEPTIKNSSKVNL